MAAYKDICVVVGEKNGKILNNSTGNTLHDFHNEDDRILAVAVSENLIVTVYIKFGVNLLTDPKFNSRSIEEWTYAHLIVMTAVKAGVVKPQCENQEDFIYWWNSFYKLASSIEMERNDRQLVLKFIIEAEKVGIIGSGCAEMFQGSKSIRSEMNILSRDMFESACNE